MPHQVDGALLHAMSGTELSRVRTELWLPPPEPNNQRLLASRGADIVMQSSGLIVRLACKEEQGAQATILREADSADAAGEKRLLLTCHRRPVAAR